MNRLTLSKLHINKIFFNNLASRVGIFLLLIGILLVLISSLNEFWLGFTIYGVITFVGSLISPVLGLALWFMPAPFEAVTVTIANFSPYTFVTPAYLIGGFLHLIFVKEFQFNQKVLFLLIVFLTLIFATSFFSSEQFFFRGVISITLLAFSAFLGIFALNNKPQNAHLLLVCLLFSALASGLYAVIKWSGYWRLAMVDDWGGGARHLDTVVSIALSACFSILFLNKRRNEINNYLPRFFIVFSTIILSMLLLGSVARGSILAIIISLMIVPLHFIKNIIKKGKISIRFILIVLLLLGFGTLVFNPIINQLDEFTGGHLTARITEAIESPADNPRWYIWKSALNTMGWRDWIFGAGLGSFTANVGHSSHSLFIGVLVETGILGLLFIVLSFIIISIVFIKKGGLPLSIFIIFFITSFLTKGSFYNKYFYFSFAVAYALFIISTSRIYNVKT